MGNRANIVIVEDGDWRLYYSHWAGCRMLDALLGGPDLALRYVQSLRQCSKGDWIDPLWADGGAIVDLDRRRLLFFGEEHMVEMCERRALMTVLGAVWRDYEIGWAYDGTTELAGYVGSELPPYTWGTPPKPKLARTRNKLCELVSVVDGDGRIRFWQLWWGFSHAWHGPELMNVLPGRGVKGLALGMIPASGIHIDTSQQKVGVWHTSDCTGIFGALSDVWSGWQAECWQDRFEEQLVRCGGVLRLPPLDLSAGIDIAQDRIRDRVFQSFADSPAGRVTAIAELLNPIKPGMVVSRDAVADCGVRPSETEWARFVASCNLVRQDHAKSA